MNKRLLTYRQLKRFQKPATRTAYLNDFEFRMIYRTTKTENPETTRRLVRRVLESATT
jgi:hypothetical protein